MVPVVEAKLDFKFGHSCGVPRRQLVSTVLRGTPVRGTRKLPWWYEEIQGKVQRYPGVL